MKQAAREMRDPKLPKNYALVLELVRKQGHGVHATLHEIYTAARRQRPGIGHTTVYRALQRLANLGLIAEVAVPGAASALFEPTAPSHGHFLCKECGRVSDLDFTLRPATLRKLSEEHDLTIDDASVILRGLCSDCAPRR
ncbi:MAG TPA: transcriptional repressor [Stellaceae bacterium]|jgi:Fe2+ or Zn2+ uptake regulation protein|nr:transcriptional repressor [Stellaceae bacterium]